MEFLFQHRLLIRTGAAVSSSGSSRFILKNAAFFFLSKSVKEKTQLLVGQAKWKQQERKSPLPTSQIDWSERQDLEEETCKQSTVRSVDQESAKKKEKKREARMPEATKR